MSRRRKDFRKDAASHRGIDHGSEGEQSNRKVRGAIARLAAKLIAEGQTDRHAAKLKAARQLGIADSGSLPDNIEIEHALVDHLALFEPETQPHALRLLRETALRLMQRIEQFSPRLTGAVLAGTANEYSEIELELIGTEAKEFELYLLNAGVRFTLSERVHDRRGPARRNVLSYECEFEEVPVVIAIHESLASRQSLYPRNSIHHDYADYEQAQKRFELD
ncbi:MAG: UDP-N-acetylmuramate--alanine ligase [Betaproteobacteria bacterium]